MVITEDANSVYWVDDADGVGLDFFFLICHVSCVGLLIYVCLCVTVCITCYGNRLIIVIIILAPIYVIVCLGLKFLSIFWPYTSSLS